MDLPSDPSLFTVEYGSTVAYVNTISILPSKLPKFGGVGTTLACTGMHAARLRGWMLSARRSQSQLVCTPHALQRSFPIFVQLQETAQR